MGGPSEGLSATPRRRRPRRCVGCGCERPKGELIRVVRSPEGVASVDAAGKAPGRGVYLCPSIGCIEAARKKKALARSLKSNVGDGIYLELKAHVAERGDEGAEPAG